MSQTNIIPQANDKRKSFYEKIGNNLTTALTQMGLDPKMGDEAAKQALAWGTSYATQQQAQADAKAANQRQTTQNTRSHNAVQAVIDQIRNNPAYTPEVQALLGTAPVAHDPAAKAGTDQPVIEQKWTAGHPDLRCRKHHHSQIRILCQRGAETTASVLATVTHPHYVDVRPNLVPGQAETRTYTMIYMDHDAETGNYSAPVSVAVLPQP